jgi:hypothetical protein
MKRVLGSLGKSLKEYYLYLVRECLSSLSRAEDYYSMHMYSSCDRMLFQSAEFFWKSLVVLSGQRFEHQHQAGKNELSKISDDILMAEDRAQLYKILSELPDSRRELATYGYIEKNKALVAPDKILQPEDVTQDLDRVRRLIEALRRIHLTQMSEPPIRIGVLSGFVSEPGKEKPCRAYPNSTLRNASQWVDDLEKSNVDPYQPFDIGDLFAPVEISVAELGSGFYPIVINPFGECFPEKGQGRGVALQTILEYIRDGGIFVNSAGHPFIYTWDVDAPSENLRHLISYINIVTGIDVKKINENQFELLAKGGAKFPGDALILNSEFKATAAWDLPTLIGPHEVEIRYSDKLKRTPSFKRTAKVFRPIVADSPSNPIPLVVTDDKSWGEVYPVAAVPYGRGFLVSCGMSLDAEREHSILLDIIETLARNGLDSLFSVKS